MGRREGRDLLLGQRAEPATATALPRRPGIGEVVVVGLSKDERREMRRLREEVRDLRGEDTAKQIRLDAWDAAYRALGGRWRRAEGAALAWFVVALAGWLLAAALLWIRFGLAW